MKVLPNTHPVAEQLERCHSEACAIEQISDNSILFKHDFPLILFTLR